MEVEELKRKLMHHDWYYQYSDDHRYWRKGKDEWDEIIRCRKLSDEHAKIIDIAVAAFNEIYGEPVSISEKISVAFESAGV